MTHKLTPNKPPVIKAGEYNAAMEAGQWFSQQRQLGGGMSGVSLGINPCVVMVKNESGGDLAAGAVVELGASLLTTLDKSHVWLSASTRSGNGVCGVLLDPIPYNSIGPCQVSGICLASVDIQDADNTHARVVPSSTQLKGDFGGYVRIVQKPSGTGVKACLVELGNHQSIIRKARTTSTITASGSGTANVYINGSSVGSVTVYHDWVTTGGDIASGLDIYIEYMHDQDKWIALASAGATVIVPAHVYGGLGTAGQVYQDGDATADTTPYQLTTSGLWCMPTITGQIGNSIGTSIRRNTPSNYDTEWVDLLQKTYYLVTIFTQWALPSLSLSNARSLFRVAGHTHSYTDNGAGMTTGTTTPDARSIDDGGVVQVSTYIKKSAGGGEFLCGTSTLRPFYDSAGGIHIASHGGTYLVSNSGTAESLRIHVVRDDTTAYVLPELYAGSVSIQQCGTIEAH